MKGYRWERLNEEDSTYILTLLEIEKAKINDKLINEIRFRDNYSKKSKAQLEIFLALLDLQVQNYVRVKNIIQLLRE